MKFVFKMKTLIALLGAIAFAVLAIAAFEGIGFAPSEGDTTTLTDLGKLIKDMREFADKDSKTIYALGVSGLVFSFVAIIFPLLSFFLKDAIVAKVLFFLGLALQVMALVLMVASYGDFAHVTTFDGEAFYDKGRLAGAFILIIAGWLAGVGTNAIARK